MVKIKLFYLIVCLVFCVGNISNAGTHTAKFTWRVSGGVVNPEQWIYDGEIPIALFEYRQVEQPEENLRYFNSVPKPPVLRYLKLTPNGKPLVEGVQLYWVLQSRSVVTDELIDLSVVGNGTERLEITFITKDKGRIATSRRILTMTYDSELGSYIYDFRCILEFQSPDFFRDKTMIFEFSDPWYVGCPGPAVEFTGMWRKRYQKFVYESEDGSLQAIPLNHFTTSHKSNIRLKRDGIFTAVYEADGNPAFQFVEDTADKSSIGICWWGYDVHFARVVTPDELDKPINTHFRIFQCPGQKAKEFAANAIVKPLKPEEWGGKKEYPVYERISSFERGLSLDGIWNGVTDPFPWEIVGEGAAWDKTSGRNDNFSLKIERNEKGLTRWKTFQGDGQGYWMEPWSPCKGYTVRIWIKTANVIGNGATLAMQYHIPNESQQYPIYTAKKLTGTNDWTRLELTTGTPPPEAGCLMLMLQQDGIGTTWFDDLEVIPLR